MDMNEISAMHHCLEVIEKEAPKLTNCHESIARKFEALANIHSALNGRPDSRTVCKAFDESNHASKMRQAIMESAVDVIEDARKFILEKMAHELLEKAGEASAEAKKGGA